MKIIWRKRGEAFLPKNTAPTVKHGDGNIMLWDCFCSNGTGNLVQIKGIMKAENYIPILNENHKVSAVDPGLGSGFSFQQDNDPKQKSKSVTASMKNNKITDLSRLAFQEPGSKSDRKFVERIEDLLWSSAAQNTATIGRSLRERMEQYPD